MTKNDEKRQNWPKMTKNGVFDPYMVKRVVFGGGPGSGFLVVNPQIDTLGGSKTSQLNCREVLEKNGKTVANGHYPPWLSKTGVSGVPGKGRKRGVFTPKMVFLTKKGYFSIFRHKLTFWGYKLIKLRYLAKNWCFMLFRL